MSITISDIKQFIYCPRVIYYSYVEPVPRKVTFKMEYSRSQHYELNQREKRRSLKRYNLLEGKRYYGVPVSSTILNLNGKLDILVDTENMEGQRYFPIECKDTDQKVQKNILYQLVAYALCIEEMTNTPVQKGYIYIIPEEKAYPVIITESQKQYIRKVTTMIRKIIHDEYYPDPRSNKRCWDCEFQRYCNDCDLPNTISLKERNRTIVQELFNKS
ncbi:CRISPR-associated protein Cas4 [Robertmurraya andreesenii]|uniref:CRISPR-associated exonuclease Cas4 n=1 Tax=Anoxybacillus andreesenii TaxID=1325932 RepID=A0ABT9VAQ7_9BACL|nr:CRISPR-associated protein Cas4 [Robertmurraya andreesenii]MDQ0158050.1 CRISPR-associated exonuclease Cas4 [Robertmurraya andreesenii]